MLVRTTTLWIRLPATRFGWNRLNHSIDDNIVVRYCWIDEIARLFLDSGVKPVNNDRKDWQNPYSSKNFKDSSKQRHSITYPTLASLPPNKWVIPRKPDDYGKVGPESYQKLWQDIDDWMSDQNIKYRKTIVEVDKSLKTVYLFKKTKDAVLFKLTWG